MADLVFSPGTLVEGKIVTTLAPAEIRRTIAERNIVLLKNVFSSEIADLVALRRAVFDWGQNHTPLNEPDPTANCHCLQAGVSRLQKTPHIYHSFNFNRLSELPPQLSVSLYRYFEPLRLLQNSISGNSAEFGGLGSGKTLHPQIIQYPRSGGMFGRHMHPLLPQRVGLIVALSRRGVDYDKGGTCFDIEGTIVEIEPHHEIGDVALFRFDIPHWVNASDLNHKFDWNSELGRWTMVLPYY